MAMPSKLDLQNNKKNAYFTILGKPRNTKPPTTTTQTPQTIK